MSLSLSPHPAARLARLGVRCAGLLLWPLLASTGACASVSTLRPESDAVLEQGLFDRDQCLRERSGAQRLRSGVQAIRRTDPSQPDDRVVSLVDAAAAIQRQQTLTQQVIAQRKLELLQQLAVPREPSKNGQELRSYFDALQLSIDKVSGPARTADWSDVMRSLSSEMEKDLRVRERQVALESAIAWHSDAAYRLCEARLNGWHTSADDGGHWRRLVRDYDLSQRRVRKLLTPER